MFPPQISASLPEQPSYEYIENCLKLLDSWLLGSNKRDLVQNDWHQGLANELVALSIISELLSHSEEDHRRAIGMLVSIRVGFNNDRRIYIARKCTETTLRVLLSFTRDDADAKWCHDLLDDDLLLPYIIRTIMKSHDQRLVILSNKERGAEEDDNEAQILDRLCLSLGLLTNLVQASHSAKDQTRKSRTSNMDSLSQCILIYIHLQVSILTAGEGVSVFGCAVAHIMSVRSNV